jgi:hypothetical protein
VWNAASYRHVKCIRVLHELGADVNKIDRQSGSTVYIAACKGHAECIRVLLALEADVNKCWSEASATITAAAAAWRNRAESVRICSRLGANVQSLLLMRAEHLGSDIPPIVQDIRSFLDATGLVHSPHQYTLYSLSQLATCYLERHASDQPQDTVHDFARRFAAVIQDSLIVAPFEAAAGYVTTTPAKRRLVRLAARTAIDAAVTHTATEANHPIDAGLVGAVMNLVMSYDTVRDLHSLRLACKLTYRRSFLVPRYPLLELPTGVVESFVGGYCSRHVSFDFVCRALGLHVEDVPAVVA